MPTIAMKSQTLWITTTHFDGYMHKNNADWATVRDATSAALLAQTQNLSSTAIASYASRGQNYLYRTFMIFDASSITSNVKSATLKIYGYSKNSADFFVVRGTQGATHTTADWDAIAGWDGSSSDGSGGGDNEGNVTKYSAEIDASEDWSTSGYNEITLLQPALDRLKADDDFGIVLINSTYDLRDIENDTGSTLKTGMYFSEYSGTSRDPVIDYELGYGNDIMGVDSSDISEVNAVATANISKVIGV